MIGQSHRLTHNKLQNTGRVTPIVSFTEIAQFIDYHVAWIVALTQKEQTVKPSMNKIR